MSKDAPTSSESRFVQSNSELWILCAYPIYLHTYDSFILFYLFVEITCSFRGKFTGKKNAAFQGGSLHSL